MKYLLALLALPLMAFGQPIKMKEATRQSWAGGIAGMHGYRYHIELTSQPGLTFTRMWANGGSIEIKTEDGSLRTNSNGKQTIYTINTNISLGRINHPYTDQQHKEDADPPITYKGVALLAYKWQGKTRYYILKNAQELQPLSYP